MWTGLLGFSGERGGVVEGGRGLGCRERCGRASQGAGRSRNICVAFGDDEGGC